jgi:putative DNA primase/helicase
VNVLNQTTAVDSADIVVDEGNADLTTEQPEAANDGEIITTPLPPPPAGDVVPTWPDRPQIKIAEGESPEILRATEQVVAQHFYSCGPRIMRLTEARQMMGITSSYLATELTRLADVTRYDGRSKSWRKTDYPEPNARAFLDRGTWSLVKPLDAIVRAPFIREDGSICDQPGYDAQSRCFADFDPWQFPELPDISEEEAAEVAAVALDKLRAPFDQIPFENPAAHSAFLALILTEAARIAVPVAPAAVITAPDQATGKTMVSKMAPTIVHGAAPSVRTWPNDADELRKTITACLMSGERTICFDNIKEGTKLRSPELGAILTAPTYSDRKLGASENLTLPNKAVVVFTGNNINPVSDLARRSIVIRLNGNMPGTELRKRTFRIPDLEGYVLKHRAELLMAALTIIKAHQVSGHVGPTVLPSFGGWSRLVRDALIWLRLSDPCETQKETDDGNDSLAEAFDLLAPKLEGRQFMPSDVQGLTMFDKQLAAALFNSGCADPSNAQRIGYWLRENRDRYGGDFRLRLAVAPATHSKRYQFERVRLDPNADLIGEDVGGAR